MKKSHIVIIGGGFGGTYTARYLKPLIKSGRVEVTIINRTNHFLFTPLLHEVATGALSPTSVIEPIQEIFRHSNVHFIQDEVRGINAEMQQVTTSTRSIPYDYLVVSSGAETNYYNIPGAKEHTFVLKDLRDAEILRKRFLDSCKEASLTQDVDTRKRLLSTIIVGAGPTGVELAAEIVEFMQGTLCSYYNMCGFEKSHMKVSLITATPDVLSQFPPALRDIAKERLIKKGVDVMADECVSAVESSKVIFADKSFVTGHTIIWVAGVKPSVIEIAGTTKEKNGRLKIDEFLRVAGHQNIFALGDVSGTEPMLAQVAVQQGKTVARNIKASIENKPLAVFRYRQKGLLVSLGQWYAVGQIFGITLEGRLMWLLWRGVYLFNFHSFRNKLRIAGEWAVNAFYPRDISED